jgi:acyl-CoA dehydrogenase
MRSTPSSLVAAAKRIGSEVAGPAAGDVDKNARFPREAVDALKQEGLLSAYVPKTLGGAGATLHELAKMSEELGSYCGATAMIFAMHQIQIACLVHHESESDYFQSYLRSLVHSQHLIGSVTSEVGVGGDMRSSICAIERQGDRFQLNKDSTTSSYGAQADDLLVTARSATNATANDQSLVLLRRGDFTMTPAGNWDPMGMRGTCSTPFKLTSSGSMQQVLSLPFSTISSHTMVPVSHFLWAGTWIGTAKAAVSRARAFVRQQAKAKPGIVPPTALRLAELIPHLQLLRTSTLCLLTEYEQILGQPQLREELSSIGYAVKLNNLKLSGSQIIVDIANRALNICGVAGYKNDSKFSLGRILRDAHAAALMVGNDRILHTNAGMIMILKDD